MNPFNFPLVDSHLDIAGNVLSGRDYRLSAQEIRRLEQRSERNCMVTMSELASGGVAVAFSTIHAQVSGFEDDMPVYDPPAEVQAERQLDIYRRWEEEATVRIIRDVDSLEAHLVSWQSDRKLGLVLLMEGSDPIGSPEEVETWFDHGLRLIGPAWSRTRHAGGTDRPGGLTSEGRELVEAMRELGITLDASHLAEESFWEALEIGVHRVVATHSNRRVLVPTDRQLSDDMILAIGRREGVVGVVLYNGFLDSSWKRGMPKLPLEAVSLHAHGIAELIGWDRVGLGSDFDGGLGYEETPLGFETAADLWRVSGVLPEEAAERVLGGNWLAFLRRALPGGSGAAVAVEEEAATT